MYALAEAEPEKLKHVWNSLFQLSDTMKCVCFLDKTISSQIASNNS